MIHEVEKKNKTEIEQFTFNKIKNHLHFLKAHSTYYQRMFNQHGIQVKDINQLSDFTNIPTTSKADLQNFNSDFLCVPVNEISEWTTTSGTLGKPVSFGLTKKDLSRLAKNEARSLQIVGCTAEDRVQLMVTLDKRFMAGLAYYLGAQEYGCMTIRVGSGSPGLQIDSILRFEPTVIIAVPSFLLKVLEYAKANQIDLSKTSVNKVICIGEPVRDAKFNLNNLGLRIKKKWPQAGLYSTYASTEMSTAITECSQGKGGHVPPDLIYIELLDESGNPVPEGSPGEVTITNIGVEAMPLLRYRTGDVCIAHTQACDCGNGTLRLSPVLGRKKQMIKYKGTTLFPHSIYEILNGLEYILDYIVILENNELGLDEVSILISVNEKINPEETLNVLYDIFQAHLRVVPKVEIKSPSEIRKIKFPSSSRKPLKLIDKRKKNANLL